jgi:hypothetical protein
MIVPPSREINIQQILSNCSSDFLADSLLALCSEVPREEILYVRGLPINPEKIAAENP